MYSQQSICRFGFPRPETEKTLILNNVDITDPHLRGRFYETKRTEQEQYVNANNPYLLRKWSANMDIQLVCSTNGLAYYVCSYIAKAERDDLKDALYATIVNIQNKESEISPRKPTHLIRNCVLKTRRLSTQEVAARVGHLQLTWSSRTVVRVNARPHTERYKLLKPKKERDEFAKTMFPYGYE